LVITDGIIYTNLIYDNLVPISSRFNWPADPWGACTPQVLLSSSMTREVQLEDFGVLLSVLVFDELGIP